MRRGKGEEGLSLSLSIPTFLPLLLATLAALHRGGRGQNGRGRGRWAFTGREKERENGGIRRRSVYVGRRFDELQFKMAGLTFRLLSHVRL